MNFSIIVEKPFYLIICFLFAFALSFFLYRKDSKFKEIQKWKIYLMFIFRFLTISIISFLLLSPLIKYNSTKIEKPILVFAQDNSKSIVLNKDSAFYKNQYLQKIDSLKALIADKYNFVEYAFGDDIEKSDSIKFNKSNTDISKAINKISEFYYDRNVGALIIASDGIYNQGQNPAYVKNLNFPVYSILLGDTNRYADVSIKNVMYNKLAFINNNFPIKVDFLAKKLKGKEIVLNVYNKDQKVFSTKKRIKNNNEFSSVDFMLKSNKKGLQHYKIEIKPVETEVNIKNNYSDAVIDIIDSKQKILIVENSPNPDISAILKSLNTNINFDVKLLTSIDNSVDVSSYNLIILHQLPSQNNSVVRVLKTSVIKKIPILFIIGEQTDLNKLKKLNIGFNFTQKSNSFDNASPILNKDFDKFSTDFIDKDLISDFSPLNVPFGDYNIQDNSNVLFKQKIGTVTTNKPLITFLSTDNTKYCFINGLGIWRWRMTTYLQKQNFNEFDELINKIVKYLALKVSKNKFDIDINNFYYDNSQIEISAQVYNSSFELENTNDVNIEIYDSNNKVFKYKFSKIDNFYKLNLGTLPRGDYKYKAYTSINGKTIENEGKFVVFSLNLEEQNTIADYGVMSNISDKNKGKIYFAKDLLKLIDDIKSNDNIKPIEKQNETLNSLINLKLLFFIIILFITLEWFYRKYLGSY